MAKSGIVNRFDGQSRQIQYREQVITPILGLQPGIETALDFGCGTGIHVKTLRDHGVDACGMEIGDVSFEHLFAEPEHIKRLDVATDIRSLLTPADLVISFEVGEHIPEADVDTFVANLKYAAKSLLVMTASHEDGEFHINPQPADYWMDKMTKGGEFKFCPEESTKLQDYFKSAIMPPTTLRWFKHRLWIFRRTKP